MRLPAVKHGEVELPQGRLHYVEAGDGEALLLVHGGHGSWTHWVANIGPLARTRRVIALDLPAFGASYNPEPAYTIEQYAEAVRGVLDRLALARAAICGFSFGCVVSAAVARAEPGRIVRLAMVNPPGISALSPVSAGIQRELSALAVRTGLRQGAIGSLRRLQLFNHALIDDAVVDMMVENVRKTKFVSRSLSRATDTNSILTAVKQPVLLLIGREDLSRQHGLAESLRTVPRAAPQTRIHIIERARHWLQFDRADLFNDLLSEFVG